MSKIYLLLLVFLASFLILNSARNADVANLQAQIDAMKYTIATQQESINKVIQLEHEINVLKKEVAELKLKNSPNGARKQKNRQN